MDMQYNFVHLLGMYTNMPYFLIPFRNMYCSVNVLYVFFHSFLRLRIISFNLPKYILDDASAVIEGYTYIRNLQRMIFLTKFPYTDQEYGDSLHVYPTDNCFHGIKQ